MRQESLGKALGVSFQMVHQYERGTVRISAAQLYDMANALDVPVGFFFDDMPPEVAASITAQGGGKAEEAPNYELHPQVKRETLQLVRAYYNISDARVRERLFAMVMTLSEELSKRAKTEGPARKGAIRPFASVIVCFRPYVCVGARRVAFGKALSQLCHRKLRQL